LAQHRFFKGDPIQQGLSGSPLFAGLGALDTLSGIYDAAFEKRSTQTSHLLRVLLKRQTVTVFGRIVVNGVRRWDYFSRV